MAYWLVKSEPSTYSFARFQRDRKTGWDGVRNHQAASHLRAMKKGDTVLFYHSGEGKEIVGFASVKGEAYPDPSDKEGKFVMIDLGYEKELPHPVSLAAIKARKELQNMALVRQSRLSVMPVSAAEWKIIMAMAEKGAC